MGVRLGCWAVAMYLCFMLFVNVCETRNITATLQYSVTNSIWSLNSIRTSYSQWQPTAERSNLREHITSWLTNCPPIHDHSFCTIAFACRYFITHVYSFLQLCPNGICKGIVLMYSWMNIVIEKLIKQYLKK